MSAMRLPSMMLALALVAAGPALAGPAKQPTRGSTVTTETIASAPDEAWGLPGLFRLGINHPFVSYGNSVPACDNTWVLGAISRGFATAESNSGGPLQMGAIENPRQKAANNWGYNNIPRRVCEAKATFSDRRTRTVNYVIREGQGMIGSNFGVTWCVQGVDRYWVYTPDCRSLKN